MQHDEGELGEDDLREAADAVEVGGRQGVGEYGERLGVAREEASQLLEAIAGVMSCVGPELGRVHWEESVGAGARAKLTQQAVEMV